MHSQSKSITEQEVLFLLDESNTTVLHGGFISLGQPYSYLIDSRLNVFRSEKGEWAIAAERLGYNPRSGYIELEIYYYGNCLKELEELSGNFSDVKHAYPIDTKNFEATTDGEALKHDAKFWLVRGQQIPLVHNKQAYKKAGINLKEFNLGEISIEEAARLTIIKHQLLFRATDDELYNSIPKNLKKIMVLNEWYHRDYDIPMQIISESKSEEIYAENRTSFEKQGITKAEFLIKIKGQNNNFTKVNKENYDNNRPSAYETWQMIAKVITTGDVSFYKPTLKPNTHWSNWPDSGSL